MTQPTRRQRPIGGAKRDVLTYLYNNNVWYRGCGWNYEGGNHAVTLMVLHDLALDSLVEPIKLEDKKDAFRLTHAGMDHCEGRQPFDVLNQTRR